MTFGEALNVSATGFIVVLIILALLACIIVVLSKAIRLFDRDNEKANKKEEKNTASASEPAKAAPATAQPTQIPAGLELYKTSEKTAATIMAIVSHESGIPLNRLAFSSIRLVDDIELYKTDDKTAATIMAIVSHQSGIPLDRLDFKSIKLIEK